MLFMFHALIIERVYLGTSLAYKQHNGSIRFFTLVQHGVALFRGGAGHVACWLVASQSDQNVWPAREPVERDRVFTKVIGQTSRVISMSLSAAKMDFMILAHLDLSRKTIAKSRQRHLYD